MDNNASREIAIQVAKDLDPTSRDRLVHLLATGVERLLRTQAGRPGVVDFRADTVVTSDNERPWIGEERS